MSAGTSDAPYRIGMLAGVSRDTLRYCERRGLLPPAPSHLRRIYLYPAAAVERLRFIRQAQDLGLTLGEIGVLGGAAGRKTARCPPVRDLLRIKVEELRNWEGGSQPAAGLWKRRRRGCSR